MSEPIIPPHGGQIVAVRVTVRAGQLWDWAIDAGAPQTPHDHRVRKVGDLYYSARRSSVDQEILLVSNPRNNWENAMVWGEGAGLKNASPQEVFAIGEQYPRLHAYYRLNPLYVMSAMHCNFEGQDLCCGLMWDMQERRACLRRTADYSSLGGTLTAYRR